MIGLLSNYGGHRVVHLSLAVASSDTPRLSASSGRGVESGNYLSAYGPMAPGSRTKGPAAARRLGEP